MQPSGPRRPEVWICVGLGVVVVLVGIAFFLSPLAGNTLPTSMVLYLFFPFGYGWLWGIFGLFFFFWILRLIFWPWGCGWGWGWGYRRRHWRRYDQAVSILRERYAKGEITKEQFEQMMRDLEEHERVPGNF